MAAQAPLIERLAAPARTSGLRRLLRYARPYWAVLLAAMLTTSLYAGVRTGRAFVVQPVLDVFVGPFHLDKVDPGDLFGGALAGSRAAPARAPEDAAPAMSQAERDRALARVRETAPQLALGVLVIVLLLPISHFGKEYISNYALGRMLVDMQRDLCAKLLTLPLGFHTQTPRGETLSRVLNDTARAHSALEQFFIEVLQSLLTLGVCLVGLFWLSWQLTLTMLLAAPALAGVITFFGVRIRRYSARRQESQADITQRLLQILAGIKIIKAFRAQDGEARAFGEENLRLFRRNMRVVLNRAASQALIEGLTQAIGIAVLTLGVFALMVGWWGLTQGTLVAFVMVMLQSYRPMKEISRAWTRLQESTVSADRFFELLDALQEPADAPDARHLAGLRRGIRVRNVSFSYGREPVLTNLSLDVEAGEMVAIVGKTGSGKTTLADLLLRLYDPDEGAIEIDGIDLRALARAAWLDHVAVVTQDPFLFAGTIRENIRYGRPEATEEEMLSAAKAAHVDEFAERLHAGYDTDVGDAGVQLSGGQRQRITIARAILKRPDVLIFDEATSALDAKSERLVQDAIDALLTGRTTFVIAHRLSTVRHADKILVLEDGGAAELGTHDDLMAKGGAYAELMAAQEFAA